MSAKEPPFWLWLLKGAASYFGAVLALFIVLGVAGFVWSDVIPESITSPIAMVCGGALALLFLFALLGATWSAIVWTAKRITEFDARCEERARQRQAKKHEDRHEGDPPRFVL